MKPVCSNCKTVAQFNGSKFCHVCGRSYNTVLPPQNGQTGKLIQPQVQPMPQPQSVAQSAIQPQQFIPQQNYLQAPVQQAVQPTQSSEKSTLKISPVGFLALIFFGALAFIMFAAGVSVAGIGCIVLAVLVMIGCSHFESKTTAPVVQQPRYIPAMPQQNHQQITCKRCGSPNITITLNSYQVGMQGRNEVRKKSLAKRTKQSVNRSIANVTTLGMWGFFTQKPSKYQENTYTRFKNVTEKIAICQSCGNSWRVR